MTNTVATEILNQLGGRKFIAMTGASSLASTDDSLSFRVGRNGKRVNAVRITLNARDLYDVLFYRIGRFPNCGAIVVAEHSDIFFDQLTEIFTEETGLLTSL